MKGIKCEDPASQPQGLPESPLTLESIPHPGDEVNDSVAALLVLRAVIATEAALGRGAQWSGEVRALLEEQGHTFDDDELLDAACDGHGVRLDFSDEPELAALEHGDLEAVRGER